MAFSRHAYCSGTPDRKLQFGETFLFLGRGQLLARKRRGRTGGNGGDYEGESLPEVAQYERLTRHIVARSIVARTVKPAAHGDILFVFVSFVAFCEAFFRSESKGSTEDHKRHEACVATNHCIRGLIALKDE
jgi:hypothetical protein